MKKLLTILLCLPLLIMAQAPQGFTYQGVATDNNGFELQNQTISIQASILSSSATGTAVWQETHTTTTDTFGIFSVVIGEGTSTNGGSSATFQEIDWGAASHFMKVEIDVSGGANYVHVGTSQMMSVPYALYAENANNINMDSISNYLMQDSIFNTAFGGGGGCDIQFPEGFDGEPLTYDLYSSPYTVPFGKNLYITNFFNSQGVVKISIDGIAISKGDINFSASWGAEPFIASSGQIISSNPILGNNMTTFNGFLVDATISALTYDLYNSPYTVPFGKNLYVTNFFNSQGGIEIYIDGITITKGDVNYQTTRGHKAYILYSGQIVSSNVSLGFNETSFNGYLADENYFADCAGGGFGGSSSTANVSLDYDSLANILANNSAFLSSITISSALDSVTVAAMIANAMGNSAGSSVPTGVVQAYSGTAAPTGWLLCDGSAVSRITYPDLFAIIDTTYGFGDGSYTLQWVDANNDGIMQPGEMINVMSTFNVPDLRGRTIIAADNMGGTSANVVGSADALGGVGGEETHTLTETEMPSHVHDLWPVTLGGVVGGGDPGGTNTSGAWGTPGVGTILSQPAGGDQPHNNMQPYFIMNYIIKY